MFKKPENKDFTLNSMKSIDRASMEFDASSVQSNGVETYDIPYIATKKNPYPVIPHPDIFNLLDRLKVRLASAYGYTLFESFIKGKNFQASAPQKKYAEEFTKEMLKKIKVTGVSFSGKERDRVVVMGTYDGSSINTKPLHFGNQEYGEELQEICDAIENEVYEYIFEDKKAQLEVFGGVDGKEAAAGE